MKLSKIIFDELFKCQHHTIDVAIIKIMHEFYTITKLNCETITFKDFENIMIDFIIELAKNDIYTHLNWWDRSGYFSLYTKYTKHDKIVALSSCVHTNFCAAFMDIFVTSHNQI